MGRKKTAYIAESLEQRLLLSTLPAATLDSPYVPGSVLVKVKKLDVPSPQTGAALLQLDSTVRSSLAHLLSGFDVQSIEPVFDAAALTTQATFSLSSAAMPADMQARKADLARWFEVKLSPDANVKDAVQQLTGAAGIETVQPNYEWKVQGSPSAVTDPGYAFQYHLIKAKIADTWSFLESKGVPGGGMRDVTTAVIDTGVDYTHQDLAGNMWTNAREIPGNGIDDDHNGFVDDIHGASVVFDSRSHSGDPMDLNGHGTHVAGIIAAQAFNHVGGVGVAYNTQIMAVRAAQPSGILSNQDIAEGILYAIDNGADVINMSFGGYSRSQLVEDALGVAFGQAVLVAAAGNRIPPVPTESRPNVPYAPFYPAALPYVLGVMASDIDGRLASFSNYDPYPDTQYEYEVAAPGVGIYSTIPGNQYAPWSGTSMAAPVVAGIAALLRSYFFDKTTYSNRFIMGQIAGTEVTPAAGHREPGDPAPVVDARAAATKSPAPGVVLNQSWLFDGPGIQASNDGDGRIDAGEKVNLGVEVINRSGTATQVIAKLVRPASDPYVTMVQDTISYGTIEPFNTADNGLIRDSAGLVSGASRPFIFSLSPDTPDGYVIEFNLHTTFLNGADSNDHNLYVRDDPITFVVQRGRDLPRVIDHDMVLTPADFWLVSSPVLIEPGVTVTVAPGTQIQWGGISNDPYSPGPQNGDILVRGNLLIQGTQQVPVNLFPSYLVSGQVVRIKVDPGGRTDLRYVTITNPSLTGIHNIDHADFMWDHYAAVVDASWITNSAFHHFPEGSTINSNLGFDSDLFDGNSATPPFTSRIFDSVILPDWENDKHLGTVVPAAVLSPLSTNMGNIYHALFYQAQTYNGSTYIGLSLDNASLRLAEAMALYFGGHVTSIRDQAEADMLHSYLQNFFVGGNGSYFYIGLTDFGHPGQFSWLDGSPLTYTEWAAGQPGLPPASHNLVQALHVDLKNGGIEWGWRVGGEQGGSFNSGLGYVFVLRLPGIWNPPSLNAAAESQAMLNFVVTHVQPDVFHDAFLDRYWDLNINTWSRYATSGTFNSYASIRDNFFATTSTDLFDKAVIDYNDNFTSPRLNYGTLPAHGFSSTYPFVEGVLINGQPAESIPTVGSGLTTFTVTYNRDMDTSVQPLVTFGPALPYTDFQAQPLNGGWINPRTWQGTSSITPVTGEGFHLMRISGGAAADNHWLVPGKDSARFKFLVKTVSSAALALQANGAEGAISLSWHQDDFDLLAGYNLYRSDSPNGTYTKINGTIIPVGGENFIDTNVIPAVPKYYKFTVLTTDLTESDFSNVASAAALDTIAPVISHTPLTTAQPAFGLRLTATISDNVAVTSATVYYRLAGSAAPYAALEMTNVSGTSWSATVPGSAIASPGLEYYLSATDGISTVYHGTPAAPHTVLVQNTPTISSVSPGSGPIQGGQSVTISGTLFQPGLSVLFGGVPASNVEVLSSSQLTCITPAHIPSQVDIKIINPDNSHATLLNGFRFQDQGIVLSIPSVSADHGAILEVPIMLSNVDGLRAVDLTITFNPGILSAQSVRVGALAAGWALSANLSTPGQVILSLANATSISGSGVLAYITYAVPGAPTTQSALALNSVLLNDGAIATNLSPGAFTVNGVFNLSGTVTYYNGNSLVSNAGLSLVGVGASSTNTNANGQFSFNQIPTGSYSLSASKSDDATQISAFDASLVLQAAANLITLTPNQRLAADVNRNGTVTSMDASYILEQSVNLLTLPFPGAGRIWDFVPSERSYPLINSDQTAQNFIAVLLGDVSGNWQSPQIASGGPVSLTMPQVEGSVGGHVTVPIEIHRNGADVNAADLVLTYDPTQLALESAQFEDAAAGMLCAVNTSQPGVVRVGFAGAMPLAADGTLLQMRFTVIGLLASPTSIAVTAVDLNEGAQSSTVQSGTVFAAPPSVVSATFEYQSKRDVQMAFSEDVSATLDAADLLVTNLDSGRTVPFSLNVSGAVGQPTIATWIAPTQLPDGNYRATLLANSVSDIAGNTLSVPYAFDFFFLNGDSNRDRSVGFADLVAVAQNYGGSGKTWVNGDFDGDGSVGFADLVTVAQRYGKTLAPSPALGPSMASAVSTPEVTAPALTPMSFVPNRSLFPMTTTPPKTATGRARIVGKPMAVSKPRSPQPQPVLRFSTTRIALVCRKWNELLF